MAAEQQDKTIKIKIDTDNPSAQRFNATIASMTASVEKLAQVLDKVTRSMKSFSRAQGKTGGPSVGKGGATQGKAGGIAESIIGDSGGVRDAAKVTEAALSSTGNNIKRFVDNAINDMQRLQVATRSIGGRTRRRSFSSGFASSGAGGFGATGAMSFGGGPGGAGGFGAGGGGYSYGSGFSSSTGAMPFGGGPGGAGGRNYGDFSSFEREIGGITPPGTSSGGKPGGGVAALGWRGRSANAMVGGAIGKMFGNGPAGAVIGGMLGETGVSRALAPFMGGIGVGLAAVKAYDFGAQSFEEMRAARINYTLNKPLLGMNAATATASVFQEQFANVASGNISRMHAQNKALNDPRIRKMLGSVELDSELLTLKYAQSPLSSGTGIKWLKAAVQSHGANAWQWVMENVSGNKLPGLGEADTKNILDIGLAQAQSEMPAEKAGKFRQAVDYYQQTNSPMANMMMDKIHNDALGRVQALRANMMSGGVDKNGNLIYETMEAKLLKGGWTLSDRAGGVQQLLGAGWGYRKAVDPMTLVSAGVAGFSNAAEVVKAGGVLGGGAGFGGSMYRLAQRNMGAGGLDVAVGRDLFGNFSKQMVESGEFGRGNAAETYLGAAGGLVGSFGADVAQQQYRLQLLGSGVPAQAAILSGKQAPIYGVGNLLNAIASSGGKYGEKAQALSELGNNPMLLQSIAMGGKLPPQYEGLITNDEAKNFLERQNKSNLLLGLPPNFAEGSHSELIDKLKGRFKSGGRFVDFMRDEVRGLSPKTAGDVVDKELSQLAQVTHAFRGQTYAQTKGALFAELMGDDILSPVLSGKGVHAAGPKGIEKVVLDNKSDWIRKQGGALKGKSGEEINAAYAEYLSSAEGAEAGVSSTKAWGDDLNAASENLIAAITSYTSAVNAGNSNRQAMSTSGRPKKAVTHQAAGGITTNDLKRENGRWVPR